MNSTPETTEAPSRRDREQHRKKQDILDVAERIFVEKGYEQASMEEIAEAAEYAPSALYRYFDGKSALFLAVIESNADTWLQTYHDATVSTSDPIEAMRAGIRAGLEFTDRHRHFILLYYREQALIARLQEGTQSSKVTDEILRWHALGVRSGQQRGIFREGDADLYAHALHSMGSGIVSHWLCSGSQATPSEIADLIIDLALRGILKDR